MELVLDYFRYLVVRSEKLGLGLGLEQFFELEVRVRDCLHQVAHTCRVNAMSLKLGSARGAEHGGLGLGYRDMYRYGYRSG